MAIITVEGLIMESEEGFVKRQIDHVSDDRAVKAIVLRVNSPGGSISGSDYIYHHLRHLVKKKRLPLVVSMGGMAASGGYYVSMAVGDTPGTIYAEPTTFTGSIGVIMPHYDLSDLMKKVGAKEDSIVSDPLKDMGSMARPMTELERKKFQALIDGAFKQFKTVVKYGRPKLKEAELNTLATGEVFTAQQAVDNHLVDKLGFQEEAVDQAIALAGLSPDDVKVVKYKAEPSLVTLLTSGEAHGSAVTRSGCVGPCRRECRHAAGLFSFHLAARPGRREAVILECGDLSPL